MVEVNSEAVAVAQNYLGAGGIAVAPQDNTGFIVDADFINGEVEASPIRCPNQPSSPGSNS